MVSNGSVKEFVLITQDEYSFLKHKGQKEDQNLDSREKQKRNFLAQFTPNPEEPQLHLEADPNEENPTIHQEQSLLAQINLNSRFQEKKKTLDSKTSENSSTDYQVNNTPDRVLSSLLQSGITGGKIERSRQILKAIQQSERVCIDDNTQSIFLDQQDTRIGVTDFLTALQVNTKQLPKQLLNLVEVLRLPQYLLANTYARQTSSQIQSRLASGESVAKRIKLDTEPNSSWLTIWTFSQWVRGRRNGFVDHVKKIWAKDQKSAPQYGVIFAVGFTSSVPVSKPSVNILTTLYVQIAQKREFWLRMMTRSRQHLTRFTIPTPILRKPQHSGAGIIW